LLGGEPAVAAPTPMASPAPAQSRATRPEVAGGDGASFPRLRHRRPPYRTNVHGSTGVWDDGTRTSGQRNLPQPVAEGCQHILGKARRRSKAVDFGTPQNGRDWRETLVNVIGSALP
jgi:hypothetical protein